MKIPLKTACALFILFSLGACVTQKRRSSYANYPDPPFYYRLKVNTVTVDIDYVREQGIADQLAVMAETYFNSKQTDGLKEDKTYLVDIAVTQRSFMYDVEMYNSIYLSVMVRDEAGAVFARENEYISGKKTIVSAAEQDSVMYRVLGRMLKDRKKRYNDIKRHRKTAAGK
jgi:hypothetical protein